MHEAVEALPDDVRFSSNANDKIAMKAFLTAIYSELASYAWHCGAPDGDYLQREAVPASEAIDEAFAPPVRQYSAMREVADNTCAITGASL